MSNHLAIATASETLRQMVDTAAKEAFSGAEALSARPPVNGGTITDPKVRIFLYQVTPNMNWLNDDLPTRRSDGTVVQRPQVALDLHYLLSFYGDESAYVPQRMLGSVARALHARPLLTREMIQGTIDTLVAGDPTHFLNDSDLASQVELVKFTPTTLNLEELSKLWSVFFNTPYVLSVSYQGSVVLIEAIETPQQSLPVAERNIHVLPFLNPFIDAVSPQFVKAGDSLTLRGKNLKGDSVKIVFGDLPPVAPGTGQIRENEIEITLPSQLRAGIQSVQVVHEIDFESGAPDEPHRVFESNLAVFVLRPDITNIESQQNEVTVDPEIAQIQKVELLFNQNSAVAPKAYRFEMTLENDSTKVDIPGGIDPGSYFVRVRVDGAESMVVLDPISPDFGPMVQIS